MFVIDNTSLRHIIERFLELKYRYLGSSPMDSIPRLATFSFAIINTSPSSEAGEHWIMIARLNRTYYYADSLARPITKYKFLNERYQKMIQHPVPKTENLCRFYTIFAALQMVNFFQTKLDNVNDVHVLNFK